MLFGKYRLKRATQRMRHIAKLLHDIEDDLQVYDEGSNEHRALKASRDRLAHSLDEATWKVIRLRQKLPGDCAPHEAEASQADEICDLLNRIRQKEQLDNLNRAIEFADMMEEAERDLENAEKLADKEAEVDIRKVNALIGELLVLLRNLNYPVFQVPLSDLSEDADKAMKELERAVSEWAPPTTLADLDEVAKTKMAEEDPSLQGDLAMLLHKLKDPENNPVSLLGLAMAAARGECSDVELMARALDRMVDDYRETLSAMENFQMSDEACLRAMDQERGTPC